MSQGKSTETPSNRDKTRREKAKRNIPAVMEAASTDITDTSDLLDLDQNAEETIPEMSVGGKQEQRRYKSELQMALSNKEQ